jgi:sec-independent protein translocase protein TatA
MLGDLLKPMHLLVLLFIAILFFGPSKLADFGKGLGEGIKNFKGALRDSSRDSSSGSGNEQTNSPAEKK